VTEVRTDRLLLRPMVPGDAEDPWPVFSDPAIWWYDPEGVHRDLARTRAYCASAGSRWSVHGLSYWTVRLLATGEVVGSGGVQVHGTGEWNLNYRLARAHHGEGYATELGRAALAAAAEHDPTRPVVAWIDAVNTPSIAVATRLGLLDRGLRTASLDDVARHGYADRPLDDVTWPRVRHTAPGTPGEDPLRA